jgi:hypothetical protein
MAKQVVRIVVRVVGQNFGHEAQVQAGKNTLHVTRTVPFGMSGVAYELASTWASTHGYEVSDGDLT